MMNAYPAGSEMSQIEKEAQAAASLLQFQNIQAIKQHTQANQHVAYPTEQFGHGKVRLTVDEWQYLCEKVQFDGGLLNIVQKFIPFIEIALKLPELKMREFK